MVEQDGRAFHDIFCVVFLAICNIQDSQGQILALTVLYVPSLWP